MNARRDRLPKLTGIDADAAELARLIKRATVGRGWCATPPSTIAYYLLAEGVTLPAPQPKEAKR